MLSVLEDSLFGPTSCECCGHRSYTVSGWVQDEKGTRAAYFVQWTEGRPDHGANFDFVIGMWGVGASPSDRVGASLAYSRSGGGFMVIDASSRPFASGQGVFSRALSREEVVGTPQAKELFAFTDAVWANDSRIGEVRGDS